ncbi:tetratricopeptide repeat protein [Deinococcus multiflagellatus]|uniref:Tetratricopeptide repeat protein n=1 Tax=Deinococcus multiflagellatus TaxID=1656887 RepID=A0ABW1ZI08_9DEIO|nr:tetratricopeptide repeat protein [Deinococcus multiflagellatus]MBZ9713175.1 tetratricopeptide repeat protein [Deinococcus multiflagellatus]
MNRRTTTGLLGLLITLGLAGAQTAPAAPATPTSPAAAPAAAPAPAAPRAIPAANYVALGVYYYEQGQFDQAYVAYRAAAELDPRNPEALIGLGRSQIKLRLYSAGIETLKRLISLDSRNFDAYISLSQAYVQQYIGAGDRATVSGNLNEALRVLTDAEALAQAGTSKNVQLSRVWNERGYVYKLQGDAARAIDAFKQAIALNADNAILLYNLGDMYYATGNLPLALESLQQAVIVDPRDPYNRAYYAKLLALSGNLTAARPEAAQAARLAPKNAYAVGQYGVVSYLAKDTATARAQLTQAVTLDPLRYPEFYYYLGRLALDSGDLKGAREQLTRAAALGSNTPEYLYYLGLSYERGSGAVAADRLKARENYERALKLNPGYKPAQDGLNRVK